MTSVQQHHIDCSINPLRQHDVALPSGSLAQKVLGEVEKKDENINPAPDAPGAVDVVPVHVCHRASCPPKGAALSQQRST